MAVASRKKKLAKKQYKRAKKTVSRAARKPFRRKRGPIKPARTTRPRSRSKLAATPKKALDEAPIQKPEAPIGRAILIVPPNGKYVESLYPTFRWLSVGRATRYQVQWGDDEELSSKYTTVSLATEATVPVEKPLRVGVVYYWRVRGGNDGGWGPWSPSSSFRVLEETP